MKREKRGRGRPRLNTSETKMRTYRISERQYKEFKEWCKARNLEVSEVIRVAIGHLMREGRLEDLLAIPEMEEFAVELIKGNLYRKKGVEKRNEI